MHRKTKKKWKSYKELYSKVNLLIFSQEYHRVDKILKLKGIPIDKKRYSWFLREAKRWNSGCIK